MDPLSAEHVCVCVRAGEDSSWRERDEQSVSDPVLA